MPDKPSIIASEGSPMAELLADVFSREAGRATGQMISYATKSDRKKQEEDNDDEDNGKD